MNKTTKESLIREAKERIDALHRNRTVPLSRNSYHSLITDLIDQAHTAGHKEALEEVLEGLVTTLGAVRMGVANGSTEEVLVDFIENYFDDDTLTDIKNHLNE